MIAFGRFVVFRRALAGMAQCKAESFLQLACRVCAAHGAMLLSLERMSSNNRGATIDNRRNQKIGHELSHELSHE
jgi:hypothetical protein